MATVLSEFDFQRGRPPKYPWHQWLDGQVWELVIDRDFGCSIVGITSVARSAARKRGVSLRLYVTATSITLQAVPRVSRAKPASAVSQGGKTTGL